MAKGTLAERIKVVLLYTELNKERKEICTLCDISPSTFWRWIRAYRDHGPGGLKPKRPGPRSGRNSLPMKLEHRILWEAYIEKERRDFLTYETIKDFIAEEEYFAVIFAFLSASFNSALGFPWWIWVFSLFILGANGIMVCKDIPDVESDRHAGMMNFTQAYGIGVTRWFVIAMALLTLASGLVLTVAHFISVIGLAMVILGTIIAVTTMMKPDEKLKERQTIYQRLPPVSIIYTFSVLVGAMIMLW